MSKIDAFGRHKRYIWNELAEQLGGEFIKGKMFRPDRVEAWHHDWMVTLDTFQVDKATFTRLRAPFINRDDFKFKIVRDHFGYRIGKMFGMQDIIVGSPQFDKDFIIQGNDEHKLKMMFANPEIRKLVSYQSRIHLELRPDAPLFTKPKFPPDVNELYFQAGTIIRHMDQLHDLFDLFAECLDHLCAIGTAYEDDPEFQYYS